VILTASITFWRQWDYKKDMTETAQLTELVKKNDSAALAEFAGRSDASHAVLALLNAAAQHVNKGEVDKALALYDQAQKKRLGSSKEFRQLALLKSITLRADNDDPVALIAELQPLTDAKSPWRFSAWMLQALLEAKQGQHSTAADTLLKITLDPETPENITGNAMTLRELYLGSVPAKGQK
jgi:hypothetical protein